MPNIKIQRVVFLTAALCVLVLPVSSGLALLLGMTVALMSGNPYPDLVKKFTPLLMQASIIGLGAGMDLGVVAKAGLHGMVYTIVGIFLTMVIGLYLGRFLKVDSATSLLVCVGTSICGGSAIAAVSPVIRAKSHEVSIALATVFFLNATALFLFPWLGHHLGLSASQFGYWSGLAIHDTSSVVGAAIQYSSDAVDLATTVKLARALWIIPLVFVISFFWNKRATQKTSREAVGKAKRPWFILGFIFAAAVVTVFPVLQPAGHTLSSLAKKSLVFSLFLIGSGLTRGTLKAVGIRPFVQGLVLWAIVASGTVVAILGEYIR